MPRVTMVQHLNVQIPTFSPAGRKGQYLAGALVLIHGEPGM
jgi:hypothetical protein